MGNHFIYNIIYLVKFADILVIFILIENQIVQWISAGFYQLYYLLNP